MKQILNINLGGHPVTIDTDAYEHLSWYLDTIEKHFNQSEATSEILADIETRMAELFKENIHPRTIVTLPDVNAAIDIMGTPEMFGAEVEEEDFDTVGSTKKRSTKTDSGFKPGKRLFRDPEDKIIGGVASGLSAYLGIADPIWLRIAFVVFTVAGFASIPIYLVLWIAMPVTKTSADRLAMKGEPINVESIADSVSEEFENLSEKFNNISSRKKKRKRKSGEGRRRRRESTFLTTLGGILSAVIIGIGHAARPFLKIIGGMLIVALILSWVAIVISSIVGISQADFYMPSNLFAFRVGVGSLFLLIGAPIMGLITSITRIAYRSNISKKWRLGFVALWTLGCVGIAYSIANVSKEFAYKGQYEETIILNQMEEKPISISLNRTQIANNDARKIHIGGGMVKMEWSEIDVEFLPAEDNQFKLVKIQKTLGKDKEDADAGAKQFEYFPKLTNNNLVLPSNFFIPKGERFRAQNISLKLFIPKGKKVVINRNLRHLDLHFPNHDEMFDKELVMTKDGLQRVGESLYQEEKMLGGVQVFPIKDFKEIEASGQVTLNVQQGDDFRVKVRGLESDNDLQVKLKSNKLVIQAEENIKNKIAVFVTMPTMNSLSAKDIKSLRIQGFNSGKMELNLFGEMDVHALFDLSELVVTTQGQVNLVLAGHAEKLHARMRGQSAIFGEKFRVTDADIEMKDESIADIDLEGQLTHFGK